MYQKNYYTESAKTRLMLDKNARKEYNEKKGSIFDEDDIADSALSYLYNDANKIKTQDFLKSNGFPTAQQRAQNQQLYGAAKEQKQIRDLLKSTAKNTLNPNVTKLDLGFLQGIYGDEEGDREYQKMLANASQRQSDLYNAFQGSPFESGLKSVLPISKSTEEIKPAVRRFADTTNDEIGHTAIQDFDKEYDRPKYADSKTVASTLKVGAYSTNKPENSLPAIGSGPDGTWKKTGFWPWQRTYEVAPPRWEDRYYWNNSFYQERTNCYAYALNLRVNPRTDKNFGNGITADFGLPVGMICAGVLKENQISRGNTLALVRYDVEELGWTMESATLDTPVPEGKWKIAIAIAPGQQYHFYRQDLDGTWSHKPGHNQATQLDASGNIITNPETADRKYKGVNYNVFCGYFIIGPK